MLCDIVLCLGTRLIVVVGGDGELRSLNVTDRYERRARDSRSFASPTNAKDARTLKGLPASRRHYGVQLPPVKPSTSLTPHNVMASNDRYLVID